MRKSTVIIVVTFCLLAGFVPAASQGLFSDNGPGMPGRAPGLGRIDNRVIDLLNEEIVLDSIDGPAFWLSAPFNTSQYNRIGLRFSAEMDEGLVTCRVGWRFGGDEEFQLSIPSVTKGVNGRPVYPDPFGRPDGIPDLYNPRQYYPIGNPAVDFTEVRGLQARVECSLGFILFLDLGDDPSLPEEPEPVDITISLTDVKVLLRKE